MNNVKILFLGLFCSMLVYNCAAPSFYSIEDVEKERAKMNKGKTKSAEALLEIYKDIKQPYDVRLAALKALEATEVDI